MEARERVLRDALAAGARPRRPPRSRRHRRRGLRRRRRDVSWAVRESRCADYSQLARARGSSTQDRGVRNLFARQAIPMAWDFAEANPFADVSGRSCESQLDVDRARRLTRSGDRRRPSVAPGRRVAARLSTARCISTDPPYYDNIGYSDLSDFFYVWLRRSLRSVHPDLLSTMLVPKAEELVANPYRHDGKDGAKEFFEDGFRRVFARARETALADFPITVYYAFKQSDAGRRRDRVDGLGDAARRDDPLGLGDHRDLADAQRAVATGCSARARTPSPPRSSSRCARAPTTRRRPTAAASSPRCTTSCPTRCASSSRARSRRSTCRRPRSARAWRCSRATRRSSRTTARR